MNPGRPCPPAGSGRFVRRTLARSAIAAALLSGAACASATLVPNSGFETDADANQWPDHWPHGKQGVSWEQEPGNRFLRLRSTSPGSMPMAYLEIRIPDGTEALELSWKWRLHDVKPGTKPWFDARILMEFSDEARNKVDGSPSPPYGRGTSDGWLPKRSAFLVPEGATVLKVMPCLFQATSGTLDLDDLVIRPTDPGPVREALRLRAEAERKKHVPVETAAKERWPAELRVNGNRLIDPAGQEVWLQGLNAGGLETLPHDPQPVRSTVVGIDEWKANAVRLPVKEEFWFGRSPQQNDGGASYRDLVDRCVMIAANRGAYLILDLHRFRAPRAEHAEFWKDAAGRYKNHPAVLFDLFNEPHGMSWEVWKNGGFVGEPEERDESAFLSDADKKKNQGFPSVGMQALVDAVRSTGARNLVIATGLHWGLDLRGVVDGHALEEPGGNGVMYAWHVYNWHKDWEKHMLAASEKYPILVGEVGADVKKMDFLPHDIQEDPATWVPDMLGYIQKHRLNWTAWCFHPGATPVMISDWNYTPTPFWGVHAKAALAGKSFELKRTR
ncbi:MAG: cellulase family glycosylhydrolase [Akkermansiaceae bacterium]|nr:cellulase family glycosylhydrolase [Akkermansiaceae bacterium]